MIAPSPRLQNHIILGRHASPSSSSFPDPADRRARRERATASLPPEAVAAFTARLGAIPGLEAEYRELPGLDHGAMLPASLGHALRWMTGETR
ncbi:MAG: hypothetical protein LBP86_09425 [Azoarcus sp.]|nr:hypothetical protein [Azoarcus sp.]